MNSTTRTVEITAVGDHAISTTRDFDHPVEKVFRAMHDPALIARWIGPRNLETVECTQTNAHGGTWTLVHRDPGTGDEYGFRGVVHGEPTPELSLRTFEWLGLPGHVSLESLRLEDLGDGRTRAHALSLYTSAEDRDGMLGSGMAVGVTEGYEHLDELLEEIA